MRPIRTNIRRYIPRDKWWSFEKYESEISNKKYAPKTVEEEVELVKKMKLGDQKAREKLIHSNLRFVMSIARKYVKDYNKDPTILQELVEEWNLWLIKAVDRFDDTKWFRLISYAVWWIRQAILQYMAHDNNPVKIPANHISLIKRIEKFLNMFLQTNNRPPTDQEIIDWAQISEDELEKYYKYMRPWDVWWLDNEIGDDLRFWDIIANENSLPPDLGMEIQSIREKILESIESILKPKEQLGIKRSFWIWSEQKTDFEISKTLNRTESTIKKLRNRATEKLKSALTLSELETIFNTLNE